MWRGGLEELVSNGAGSTLSKYFSGASGLPTVERVGTNGPLSYLGSDGLGSVSEALDGSGSGNVTYQQLYSPYGAARYTQGSSPTSHGYTGQQADATTGLDYYRARYYDPLAGQFTSADSVADGLNRYAYVAGNPTTATDPSGHRICNGGNGCGGDGGGDGGRLPPPPSSGGGHGGGGHGGGGSSGDDGDGGDTGPHGSCKDSAYHPECSAYYDWQRQNGPRRWDALGGLRTAAGVALVVAAGVLLAAGLIAVAASRDPVTILETLLDMGEGVYVGILGMHLLTNAAWNNNYASGDDLNAVSFALAALTSAVNSVLGILVQIAKLGWLGKALKDVALPAAIEAAKMAATGGIMGVLIKLVMYAAKGIVGVVATAGAQWFLAAAMGAKYTFDQNLNMDLETWCDQHDDVCTKAPANTF